MGSEEILVWQITSSGTGYNALDHAMVADHSVRFIAISYMLDQVRLSVAPK